MSTYDFSRGAAASKGRQLWRNFARNRDGAAAIILGLAFLPILSMLADAAAALAMEGGLVATLSAPASGAYKDILMFQPTGLDGGASRIRNTRNQTWKGIVYTPSWDFRIESADQWNLQVNLVANTMEFKGLSSWTAARRLATSGTPSVARLVN